VLVEVAHPGAAGLLTLIGAVLATLVAGFGIVAIALAAWDGIRGKGWTLDRGVTVLAILAAGASVGLWYLTIRFLPDTGRLVVGIGRVLLVAVLILGALGSALAGVAALASEEGRKGRALGAGGVLLSLLLSASVVVTFAGFDALGAVPRFLGAVGSTAASIPLGVWAATAAAAFLLGVILGGGLAILMGAASGGGSRLDASHRWTDHRGQAYAQATRQEVYDHYHGRGSWYAMMRFWELGSSFAGLAIPVVAPLAVMHVAGWLSVWSRAGILLAVVLGAISVSAGAVVSRLRR
jgi:hypothetical protein